MNDIDDLYCDELVQRFSEILSGDRCASFTFAIQIPTKFVVNNMSETKMILQKYLVKKHLSKAEILELISITQSTTNTFNTLNEMLQLQITDLLRLGYDFYAEENCINFNLKSTIFISEDISMSLEDVFLTKIITLLECYEGEKSFYVHTSFINGVGNIAIQA